MNATKEQILQAALEADLTRQMVIAMTSREHRDRRERIATAALQGLLADHTTNGTRADYASWAVAAADALIRELDKKEGGT